MSFDRNQSTDKPQVQLEAEGGDSTSGAAPKVQFSDAGDLPAVQTRAAGSTSPSASDQAFGDSVQGIAGRGVSGARTPLPHGDKIAASFGPEHAGTVGGIDAHVGGKATDATRALHAKAYATGSSIAFGSEPDLHTAAHEAAHVVQQQRGVHLKGGVGQVGDAYEQNADAVADRVVQGKPAGDLLGPSTGTPASGGPVQMLHGDLETPVRSEFGGDGQLTIGAALAAKDQATGTERDKNLNNARKVEFEGKLAAAILRNPAAYAGAVHQTSRGVLSYLQRREALLKVSLRDSLMQLGGMSNFFGRLMDDIKGEHEPMFLSAIQGVLAGGGSIPNHMLIHHQFWTKIYEEQDFAQGKAQELVDGLAGHPAFVRHKTKIEAGGAEVNPFDKDQRGRDASVNKGDATVGRAKEQFGENKVNLVDSASGFAEHEATQAGPQAGAPESLVEDQARDQEAGLNQSHTRGVDMWTVNESKAFTQKARLVLDMPIAAGVSGTTADLMGCCEVIGGLESQQEKMQYGLAVLGFLGAAGAHSFHEILTVVNAAGGRYEEGNYRGVYPAGFEATADFQKLRAEYPDLLGGEPLVADQEAETTPDDTVQVA